VIGKQQSPPALPGVAGLTEREVEVLRLVAKGYTNRKIATALMISEHTVSKHVSSILTKLDCASRAEAAVYAVRAGW
jgi:DNA-binding NarL/FixJ family response regulator